MLNIPNAMDEINAYYKTLFNGADEAILIMCSNGLFVECNPKALETFKVKKEQILNRHLLDCVPLNAQNGESTRKKIQRFLDNKSGEVSLRCEMQLKRPDGSSLNTEVLLKRIESRGKTFVLFTVLQQSNHAPAKEWTRILSAAVDQSSATIIITNIKGEIEYANPKFTKLTGYTLEETIGKNPKFLQSGHTRKDEYADLWQTILSGKTWKGEFKNRKKNGDYYWECATIAPVLNESDTITHFVAVKDDITEQKRIDLKIKESEERYRTIFDNLNDIFFITDINGTIIELGPTIKKHLGFNREKLIGTSSYDLYCNSKDRELLVNKIREQGYLQDYEIEFKNVHNQKVYCSVNAKVFYSTDNNPIKIEGLVRNITERKLAMKEAKENETKIQAIAEQTMNAISLINMDGEYVYTNPAFSNITGYTEKELLKMKVTDLALYSDINQTVFQKIIDHTTFSSRDKILHKNNTVIDIEICGKIIEINHEKFVLGIFRDISSLVKKEAELKVTQKLAEEKEARMQAIYEQARDGITLTDKNGKYIVVNPAFCEMLGYSEKELLNMSIKDVTASDERSYLHNKIMNTGRGRRTCVALQRKDKSIVYVDVNGKLIKYGDCKAALGIVRDVTDIKKTNEELLLAKEKAEQSDRLKSAFLANISHEIRTPMNGILGFASLLKEPGLSTEFQQQFIADIEVSGLRMLNIIEEIVHISKIDAGLISVSHINTDINKELKYIYNSFRAEAHKKDLLFSLNTKHLNENVAIVTDVDKFYCILTNLLRNAFKYTDEGFVEIGYVKEANLLMFFVKDSGIGIPKERQSAIFERFIQADIEDLEARQGAGLGLSITKAFVEMLGGKIWVESNTGEGSIFYFTLPC